MKLSIIIPCYNEEKTLSTVLDKVVTAPTLSFEKEIIVINDGSRDTSKHIIDTYVATHPGIVAIHLAQNSGKGTAVKVGLERATGDYLIIQDADLEYDPNDIQLLLQKVENKNVVLGSRNLDEKTTKGKLLPRLGVWCITQQFNFLYRQTLTDIWTCYKLFPKESKALFTSGGFEAEVLFMAALAKEGFTIVETAISYAPRTKNEGKKITYTDGIRTIYTLSLFWLRSIFNTKKI